MNLITPDQEINGYDRVERRGKVRGYHTPVKFNHTASTILNNQTTPVFSDIFTSEVVGFDEANDRASCRVLAVFEIFENLDCFLTVQPLDTISATAKAKVNCIEIAKDYILKKFSHPLRLMQLKNSLQ